MIELRKIEPYIYEIAKNKQLNMHVPALLFANETLISSIQKDRSLQQLANIATLPGVVQNVVAMPDIHEGYGFPIGGVAATRVDEGVISPGGVGYDINCGVRALVSDWNFKDIQNYLEPLIHQIYRDVPCGFNQGNTNKLSFSEIENVLEKGVDQLLDWGFAEVDDHLSIESYGRLKNADASLISKRAKERGLDQLGSLGSGNHFLEIQTVTEIYEPDLAQAWGIAKDKIMIMIHTGSRGLGHQTCTDYVREMVQNIDRWKIPLPDKELACAPLSSEEGMRYLNAMAACANFAWANRQMITHRIRQAWKRILGNGAGSIQILYDVAHNIAKIETHRIGRDDMQVCVHRKGATRAFPKGHPELLGKYRQTGQPVIIPGTMGTASYILVGTELAMEKSFGTVCHGAGRTMSRTQAKKIEDGHATRTTLQKNGIIVKCASNKGLSEEAPFAYKDVHEVVQVVHEAGLARKVARLRPIAVIKGA